MVCIISGCKNAANNNFGVRLRTTETNAIWAPNTDAFICDEHAVNGMKVTVVLEPKNDGHVSTAVSGGGQTVQRRMKITKTP